MDDMHMEGALIPTIIYLYHLLMVLYLKNNIIVSAMIRNIDGGF